MAKGIATIKPCPLGGSPYRQKELMAIITKIHSSTGRIFVYIRKR
jgi:hypothetical protein